MTTSGPLRVGDAERDSAAAALSEHYASGRLTKTEYDERLEAVWAAKYDVDVRALFSDLPGPHGALDVRKGQERVATGGGGSEPVWQRPMQGASKLVIAPLMLVLFGAVLFAVLRGAPWLLFVAFWFFLCGGGFGHARRHHRRHHHRHA